MKTTYSQLNRLQEAFNSVPLRGQSLLSYAENLVKIEPHLKASKIVQDKLVESYAKDGTNQITSQDPRWPEFLTEFNKIMNQEIEIVELKPALKSDLDLNRPSSPNQTNNNSTNLQTHIAFLLLNELLV